VPDEGTIITALKHLGISAFNKALKSGWRIRFITQPTIAKNDKGWWAQLELPPACPVSEVVTRKPKLAHNLVRFPREVWPTEAKDMPGVLDLFVLNPGALSKPVEPWPLLAGLDTARVDYFTGVPVAVTLRGDVVHGRLYEANYFFGGMPGSGKSTMAIVLCCGAMLDPLVEIDVVVMAFNADYDAMEPRLRSLNSGPPDDMVEPAMALLSEAFADLDTRGQALREHGEQFITRELAEKDPRLHPRVIVIDECQHLFLSATYGPTAIKMAKRLITTSRKYGLTTLFLTPEPTNDSCPRQLMSVISNKACFPIGDQTGNDATLGTGSHKAGYTAVGLEPKTVQPDGTESLGDIGTCMARGFTPVPQLMRSFRNRRSDVDRVVARAMALRVGVQQAAPAEKAVPVDHLADIMLVLGAQPRARTEEVMSALAARNPRVYQPWSHGDLKACLAPWGAQPYKTGGFMQVNAERVREAIRRRDSGDQPDETRS
jgi:S-DNA-T family DNA segregation ATPase FtsK/SpoIIIE